MIGVGSQQAAYVADNKKDFSILATLRHKVPFVCEANISRLTILASRLFLGGGAPLGAG
jgi:hypothetical protein